MMKPTGESVTVYNPYLLLPAVDNAEPANDSTHPMGAPACLFRQVAQLLVDEVRPQIEVVLGQSILTLEVGANARGVPL